MRLDLRSWSFCGYCSGNCSSQCNTRQSGASGSLHNDTSHPNAPTATALETFRGTAGRGDGESIARQLRGEMRAISLGRKPDMCNTGLFTSVVVRAGVLVSLYCGENRMANHKNEGERHWTLDLGRTPDATEATDSTPSHFIHILRLVVNLLVVV
ncbi:uncharacterized protein BDR25DRAFT_16047 [Lindgomyces ingoldianus]|uniref:Uncharacterized protein n=1 Tax=Lindgomyces ingoldianus TaxID=673940 RepID=A0ACB6QZZ2_9PLEO|nr:uncharacterized protein BDR25DRAFT_16047 [Lindgomyces ingoldianus]KAF2472624.1 hypothetical protein BDR25DRAFT_16047 [Lindgomyces ingoldianus]